MRIAIVGAGMAGLSCATSLQAKGHSVTLFDKGRGPGGRMSTRRLDSPLGPVSFDHGAQYFTVCDAAFRLQVEEWESEGHAVQWPMAATDAWIGIPTMNAVVKAMAHGHDVRWNTRIESIKKVSAGWSLFASDAIFPGYDAAILAIPAEQALPFLALHDFSMARETMFARSQPCWTAMFAFAGPLPGGKDIIRNTGNLGWAVRNCAKPGRTGPEGWVVQASPEWSNNHLEDEADTVLALLLEDLSAALAAEVSVPIASSAHRWRYAMSTGLGLGAIWNPEASIGLCGDWLLGPRVECAWLSGRQLARTMMENPSGRRP